MKPKILFFSIPVLFVAVAAWFLMAPRGVLPTDTLSSKAVSAGEARAEKWEAKVDEQENVTVRVTPSNLSPRSAEWKFDVSMSTHTVELDQDMTTSVVLIDDRGKEHTPTWIGAPAGGHHRGGTLIFKISVPAPKSITLRFSGIGGVIRNFSWQL
ncbi:MAG: hypothetical protein A3H69_04755 [Candidatus Sungbacteria bacterium RIFCSPLOWO2_02_FULL_47_9]|nr:MAG: hypothetical protein A3H69_04755 [Candidatus Sungbacteria bacterium RIFCSPLOWO2_02_FULL_47_9]